MTDRPARVKYPLKITGEDGQMSMRVPRLAYFQIFAIALMMGISSAFPAYAESVVFGFEGSVQRIEAGDPSLIGLPDLLIHTPVSGRYFFDPTVSDSNADSHYGIFDSAIISFQIKIGDKVFEIDTTNFTRISTVNDSPLNSFVDVYSVLISNSDELSVQFGLRSDDGCIPSCPPSLLLTSDEMPLNPPDLALTDQGSFIFVGFFGRRMTVFVEDELIIDIVISELERLPAVLIEKETALNRMDNSMIAGFHTGDKDSIYTGVDNKQYKAFTIGITNETGLDEGLAGYTIIDFVPTAFDVTRASVLNQPRQRRCTVNTVEQKGQGTDKAAPDLDLLLITAGGLSDGESCIISVEVETEVKGTRGPLTFLPTDCPGGTVALNNTVSVADGKGQILMENYEALALECW